MLERFCGVDWQMLEPGRASALEGSSLTVEPFAAGEAIGFFRDARPAASSRTSPALAGFDETCSHGWPRAISCSSTGRSGATTSSRGSASRRAAPQDMGHVPLSGPDGTLEALARLERPRKVLVHINNTNPILLEDSPERERGRARGRRGRLRWARGRAVTDEFVARLRAQGARYHNLHPFHRRMDAGELTREELQRWVANRFYYQKCIPLKDAAILSNCPEVEVRREWIQRIIDHDGTAEGTGGIESWLRLGEALGVTREELESERRVAARRALRGRRVRRTSRAGSRGSRRSRHRSPSSSGRARSACGSRRSSATTRGSIPRGSSTSAPGSCWRRATRSTRSISPSSAAGRPSSRTPPSRRCASRPRCCGRSSTPSSAATRSQAA